MRAYVRVKIIFYKYIYTYIFVCDRKKTIFKELKIRLKNI